MPDFRRFAVTGFNTVTGVSKSGVRYRMQVALRCTVCGKWSPRFPTAGENGGRDDSAMLGDLTEWADEHECARMRVT